MKATDIRVGNLYNDNGTVKTVTPNVISEVWESERPWCKPIPLTEEWLLKCKNDNYEFYKQADGSYSLVDDYGDGTTLYLGSCKYLHQLQNLYFALTGEELTITN